jgi:hypothetical protein
VRSNGGRDEGLSLRLLQAEGIVLAGLVALVVVDGDFERLRETVVGGIAGGELKALGRAADSAGGVDDLERVLVVEALVLAGGGGNDDLRRKEGGKRGGDVLSETARVVGQRDVVFGRRHGGKVVRAV